MPPERLGKYAITDQHTLWAGPGTTTTVAGPPDAETEADPVEQVVCTWMAPVVVTMHAPPAGVPTPSAATQWRSESHGSEAARAADAASSAAPTIPAAQTSAAFRIGILIDLSPRSQPRALLGA